MLYREEALPLILVAAFTGPILSKIVKKQQLVRLKKMQLLSIAPS